MPAVAFGQSAWIIDVLDLIESRISTSTGYARDKVFTYLGRPEDLTKAPPAEKFITVGVRTMRADLGIVAGGGAEHSAWDSTVLVNCFSRLGRDRENQDTKFLKDASQGLAADARKACVAVQLFAGYLPADSTKAMFREPARIPGITWNPRVTQTGWGWAEIETQIKFRTDLRT